GLLDDDDIVIGEAAPPPSAELERLQSALAEKERERAAADAERQAALAELKRIQEAHPPKLALVDDNDIVIGEAAPPPASAAELERLQSALAEKERERAAADAARQAAVEQFERME